MASGLDPMGIAIAEAEAAAVRGRCRSVRSWSATDRCWREPATARSNSTIPPPTPNSSRSAPRRRRARSASSAPTSMSRWNPARCARRRSRSPASGGSTTAPTTRRAGRSTMARASTGSRPAITRRRSIPASAAQIRGPAPTLLRGAPLTRLWALAQFLGLRGDGGRDVGGTGAHGARRRRAPLLLEEGESPSAAASNSSGALGSGMRYSAGGSVSAVRTGLPAASTWPAEAALGGREQRLLLLLFPVRLKSWSSSDSSS